MFPWLTFLTFPEPKNKRVKVYQTQALKGECVKTVQVLKYIPWLRDPSELSESSQTTKISIRSLQSPQPSTSSKSPRPCSSTGSSSQPHSGRETFQSHSARDKQLIFAPPPEPKPTRSQRKGLETSSAMLALFGGGPSPFAQEETSKKETPKDIEKPQKSEEVTKETPKENSKVTEQPQASEDNSKEEEVSKITEMIEVEDFSKSHGPSACFQEINHPEDTRHYGRRNVLENESNTKTEWETIKTHPTTTSAFQTIEDHDAKYVESVRRAKWESTSSHFNTVASCDVPSESTSGSLLAQPGPEKFEEDEDQTCPAEEYLKNPEQLESIRCNLQNDTTGNNEVVISEEFIPDEVEQKRRFANERNYDNKDGQMGLNNPGPELTDDEDNSSEKELSSDGQKVAMDAMTENIESMCLEQKAKDESIQSVQPKAEPALARVFESTSAAISVLGTLVAVSGRVDSVNYTFNKNSNQSNFSGGQRGNPNNSRDSGRGSQMVSLGGGSSGTTTTNGSGSGEKPILIRGGQIVNDDSIVSADILIEEGIIKQVSPSLQAPENAEVIEAGGKLVLPAGIDAHTEFSIPGTVDDIITGTKAALAGGTTTVIDVVVPRPEDTLLSAFERCRQQAQQRSACNIGLSVVVSKWSDATRSEMEVLVREKGVNSFILDLFSDSDVFAACEHAKELGALVRILPENKDLASVLEKRVLKSGVTGPEGYAQSRPPQLEADRIQHVSNVAHIINCPMTVLSVTSSEATRAVHQARRDGTLISAEVPVIAVTGPNHSQPNILPKIPLREGGNNTTDALELLANGPLSMCVSDHCAPAVSNDSSFVRISKGVTGVEERLMVLWEKAVTNGRIDPMRFVAVTSSNPAKTFNLYPQKGRIGVGADADVVVWDIKSSKRLSSKTHLSKADSSIFESLNVRAQPTATICSGKIVFKDGKHVGVIPGMGAFLELKPNSPFVFSVVHLRENINTFNLSSNEPVVNPPRQHVDDRPLTGSGARNRNIQSDQTQEKPRTKVIYPPGGKPSGFW